MLQLQKLPVDILIWENVDLCFRQKYTLTSRLGGGAGGAGGGCQDLAVRSTFRIEFLICEWPLKQLFCPTYWSIPLPLK